MRKRNAVFAARVTFVAILLGLAGLSAHAQDAAWQKEISEFREKRAAGLQKPDGWLALVGLEWLQPGETSVGSAADNKVKLSADHAAHLGIFRLENNVVTLLPPKEGFPAGLTVGGSAAKQQTLRTDADDDKNSPHLIVGTLDLYAIRRADRFALRIKDAHSPSLLQFHGLNWYAPDAAYRVTAKWIPYAPQKTVSLLTLVGTSYLAPMPGAAEFTLQGKTYRGMPVSLHFIPFQRTGQGGRTGSRFQQTAKSALRLHAVRNVSAAAAWQQTAGRIASGRKALP